MEEIARMERNYDGILIGFFFAIGTFLSKWTFVIPIFSVFPGVVLEHVVPKGLSDKSNENVGRAMLIILSVIMIVVVLFTLYRIRKTRKDDRKSMRTTLIVMMILIYLALAPLSFYIYWAYHLHYRGDGQLIFGAVESVPAASWIFLPVGLIMDLVKNIEKSKKIKRDSL